VIACEPESGSAFVVIEGVTVSDVALVVDHVKVTTCPAFTAVESAVNASDGADGAGLVLDELPPQAARPNSSETTPRTNSDCNRRRGTGIPQFVSCLT
jgi:hypothetical protein